MDKNIWLIRGEFNDSLNNVSVDLGLNKNLSKMSIDSILNEFKGQKQGVSLAISSSIASLFVNSINIKDIAVVTTKSNKDIIYIVEIISDYIYLNHNHTREVKVIHKIEKTSIPKELLHKQLKTPRLVSKLRYSKILINLIHNKGITKALCVKFPLREDFNISFEIPQDITKGECDRLSNMIKSLYKE